VWDWFVSCWAAHPAIACSFFCYLELAFSLYFFCFPHVGSLFETTGHRDEVQKEKNHIPETSTGELGTAKRNIHRKHDHDPNLKAKPQHGGAGGKGKWSETDDGTMPE
jgi:hypothetical protein